MQSCYIPRVVYEDSVDQNGNVIPNQPEWDLLFSLCNPYTHAQDVQVHLFDGTTGAEPPCSPLKFTLQPGHSLANTLIKGNTLQTVPGNFAGWATVVFPDMSTPFGVVPGMLLPIASCLGGDGPGELNWNYGAWSADPVGTNQVDHGTATRLVFPYLIPYFMDPTQHAGTHVYATGLSITNLGSTPASLQIKYTVGDTYGNAGQQLVASVSIPANSQYDTQIHELFPQVLTMNQRPDGTYEGSEGWLDITSTTPVNLLAWLINSNVDYNYFGFGQRPWIIA